MEGSLYMELLKIGNFYDPMDLFRKRLSYIREYEIPTTIISFYSSSTLLNMEVKRRKNQAASKGHATGNGFKILCD